LPDGNQDLSLYTNTEADFIASANDGGSGYEHALTADTMTAIAV
jgi:hypothetical protein